MQMPTDPYVQTDWKAANDAARALVRSLTNPADQQFAIDFWMGYTLMTDLREPAPQTDNQKAIAHTLARLPITHIKPYDPSEDHWY